eukprot:635613_1
MRADKFPLFAAGYTMKLWKISLTDDSRIRIPKMNKSEHFPPDNMTTNDLQSNQKEPLMKHLLENPDTKPIGNVEQNENSQQNAGKILKVHTLGQKQFDCSDCPRRFALRSSLVTHRKVHTGRKQFVCSECQRPFYRKDNLRRHELTHAS